MKNAAATATIATRAIATAIPALAAIERVDDELP
jgi:hypothetical protein